MLKCKCWFEQVILHETTGLLHHLCWISNNICIYSCPSFNSIFVCLVCAFVYVVLLKLIFPYFTPCNYLQVDYFQCYLNVLWVLFCWFDIKSPNMNCGSLNMNLLLRYAGELWGFPFLLTTHVFLVGWLWMSSENFPLFFCLLSFSLFRFSFFWIG